MTSLDQRLSHITFLSRVKIGTVAGLVGGFAIFLIIFAIDFSLGIIPGTFYKMVGIPLGLEGTAATIFGMIGHMLTAALIGAVFCFCSGLHPKLDIRTSKKGALAGSVTGVAVYAIFFLPITLLIMNPALESLMTNQQGFIETSVNVDAVKLIQNIDLIMIGSLEIHLVFGMIMGIFCGMAQSKEQEGFQISKDIGKTLKIVTIGIILATASLGTYYAIISSQPLSAVIESQLNAELNKVVDGLTYTKFVAMTEQERTAIVQIMPVPTINLLLSAAAKSDTVVSEGIEQITPLLKSPGDLRFIQTAKWEGVKGNEAKGKAVIVSTGDRMFLRLEEFDITNGLDLYVHLTKSGDISTGIEVGKLKANHGEQNYEITGINTNAYNVVVIYSKSFDVYYAKASLPSK